MSTYGGNDFTGFRGVNLRGSVQIRLVGDAVGTLSFDSSDAADRAWRLPQKSGNLPIMGTFVVHLPAVAAGTNIFSTIVTVSGITAEDGLVVQMNRGTSVGYGFAGSTGKLLVAAQPGSGNITLTFNNPGVGTAYAELVGSYLATR